VIYVPLTKKEIFISESTGVPSTKNFAGMRILQNYGHTFALGEVKDMICATKQHPKTKVKAGFSNV
jgi:hypothetical protein